MTGASMTGGAAGELPAGDEPVTLVVHGHFYQPPREDPRTGAVPVEPGAEPWHDFNARITAECYHPNLVARVVDGTGRIIDLVDNYAHMSFNVGPTLLAWLEENAPETYERIRASAMASGNAIAQGFNHVIMPLCNERDLRTQIRWGLADFRHRFGREAEGMWLPETAVDDTTLRALAEEGVAFTILAPRQAAAVRASGSSVWSPVDEGSLDTSVPYRWVHPDRPDLGVTLLFYEGGLSNEVAFGIGALTSEAFVDRCEGVAKRHDRAGRLVTLATDGETFGHHHRFADRTLAFALAHEAPRRGVRVASAAEAVRTATVLHEVRVLLSSWSCAHGVGRWSRDCGCHTGGGPGWHQRWRAPLRAALDVLRDQAAAVFERRGAGVLRDPWAARDAWVDVVIGARSFDDFASEHCTAPDDADSCSVARTLLESQKLSMAMFTSCGWFFNDIAGIEARIVLRSAAGLLAAMRSIGEVVPDDEFVAHLAQAEGNTGVDGAAMWASVLEEVSGSHGAPHEPRGGWAPVISDRDGAEESIFEALRHDRPIPHHELARIGRALGVAVPDWHSRAHGS